jgi:hypothetical protein
LLFQIFLSLLNECFLYTNINDFSTTSWKPFLMVEEVDVPEEKP